MLDHHLAARAFGGSAQGFGFVVLGPPRPESYSGIVKVNSGYMKYGSEVFVVAPKFGDETGL